MRDENLVSVIIPIYNVVSYLERCINSVLAQTYRSLEIILIDDGSTDGSAKICESYAKQDTRIKVIRKANGGVSSARNAGINSASGKWVMFVDADDIMPPQAIEHLVVTASQTNADCTTGMIRDFIDGVDPDLDIALGSPEHTVEIGNTQKALEQLLYQQRIFNGPVAKLYKLKIIENTRFKIGVTIAEDLYFNYQALKKVKHVAMTSSIVYFYRLRDGSAMHQPFSHRRMDGLDITELILKDSEKENRAVLPAINRLFMEATFILQSINGNKKFHQQSSRCLDIVKRYRLAVLTDLNSPLRHRILACLSLIHPSMVTLPDRLRGRLPSRAISKGRKL